MEWHELTSKQQNRLAGLAATLEEFAYGFDQIGKSEKGSIKERFYSNVLYQYITNLFIAKRQKSTLIFLNEIGEGDLVAPVYTLLQRKFGDHTLKYLIKIYRDKWLVHTHFTLDQLERELKPGMLPTSQYDPESLPDSMLKLFASTYNLFDNLMFRFPELRS